MDRQADLQAHTVKTIPAPLVPASPPTPGPGPLLLPFLQTWDLFITFPSCEASLCGCDDEARGGN